LKYNIGLRAVTSYVKCATHPCYNSGRIILTTRLILRWWASFVKTSFI